MTAAPETLYAETPDGYIGYQVFGAGARDLLFITNWVANVVVMWEEPSPTSPSARGSSSRTAGWRSSAASRGPGS